MKVEVDFDNLRLGIQHSFNKLSEYLEDGYSEENMRFYMEAEVIDGCLTVLRNNIATLMCLHQDGVINDISDVAALHQFDVDY
jgi:hypothetical protein